MAGNGQGRLPEAIRLKSQRPGATIAATSSVAGINRMAARMAPATMAAPGLPDSDQDAKERPTHSATKIRFAGKF